jgi:hypothetical protein
MLLEEARWLNQHLSALPPDSLYPMCNVGSSTEHYRRVQQPYVHKYLFEPALAEHRKVVHVDLKAAPGVDLVGDLGDAGFVRRLADLNVRSVMCCNLLEHLTNRQLVCKAIMSLLPPGGYVIASVPYRFPHHEDPIDTMYRPTISELAQLFDGTSLCKGDIIRASRVKFEMGGDYRALSRLVVSSLVPVYRPQDWKARVRRVYEILRGFKVTCVILRKEGEAFRTRHAAGTVCH